MKTPTYLSTAILGVLALTPFLSHVATAATIGAFRGVAKVDHSAIVESDTGARLRLTPYGSHMLRVQVALPHAEFLPDDWLPYIERHDRPGELAVRETPAEIEFSTGSDGVTVRFAKQNLAARWFCNGATEPQLVESSPASWTTTTATLTFAPDAREHFAGMGHGFYGRDAAPLDLHGRTISRSYGYQASLVVPWFLSSKGYGFFLNCAFPHQFRFDAGGRFDVSVTGVDLGAQLDYVIVAGRTPLELIDRYTQLTGRPRLQRRAMFGLQLSDKPHEAESRKRGAAWWYENLPNLRAAGFPVDAIVMDNTWRAGGGTWENSIFAFDAKKYPEPKAFREWGEREGVMMDVDFNGTMYVQSDGWKPEYGIRAGMFRDHQWFYLPNYFDGAVTDWFWSLVWKNALNPELGYPNDMLWLDETDQASVENERAPFWHGRPWMELKNMYIMAGAKAVVSDWDRGFHGRKRPYVWFRSSAAGMQRYCTYWTGDTNGNEADQAAQVSAMLAAGISGQPYFNHDAGGYHSIDEPMYRRYGIVTGSFSPVWRIHGLHGERWPNAYPEAVQALAHKYADLRYRTFPYIYSIAREASVDGTPMARAMFIEFPQDAVAWARDEQYMWGPALLVAPPVASRRDVWLPPGTWFNWWTGEQVIGDRKVPAPLTDDAAVYVRAGAIVPMGEFALSSEFIPNDRMEVHVWVGADGHFDLYEDDGKTEDYRSGASSVTRLEWDDSHGTLRITPANGSWKGAPTTRTWTLYFHGGSGSQRVMVDGTASDAAVWNEAEKLLKVSLKSADATHAFSVRLLPR